MLVRATNRGFYHWIRQVGEQFQIPDALYEPTWQEPVESATPIESSPPSAVAEAPTASQETIADFEDSEES